MPVHWFPACLCALWEPVCRAMMVPDLTRSAWHHSYPWTVSPLNNTCTVKMKQTNKQINNENNFWEYNHQFFMSLYWISFAETLQKFLYQRDNQLAKFQTDLLKSHTIISVIRRKKKREKLLNLKYRRS